MRAPLQQDIQKKTSSEADAVPKNRPSKKNNLITDNINNYDIPSHVSDDDRALLHNVLAALQSTDLCTSYKVDEDPEHTCFLIRGRLPDDVFEVDAHDIYVLHSVSPLRVQRVVVARVASQNEIVVQVLNNQQRVIVVSEATFLPCKRRRMVDMC